MKSEISILLFYFLYFYYLKNPGTDCGVPFESSFPKKFLKFLKNVLFICHSVQKKYSSGWYLNYTWSSSSHFCMVAPCLLDTDQIDFKWCNKGTVLLLYVVSNVKLDCPPCSFTSIFIINCHFRVIPLDNYYKKKIGIVNLSQWYIY